MSELVRPPTTFVGQPVKRVEDPVLLTGRAQLVDDLLFPGMLHAAFLPSPHAHARILSIDVSEALKVPGVEAILTGEELKQHGSALLGFQMGWATYALAVGKVRFVGEPVVAVAALSRHVAEDALELIHVEYDILPAVTDARDAVKPEAARLYEDQHSNVLFRKTYTYGDPSGALSASDLVLRGEFRFPRVSGNPMETAGCVAQWDPLTHELTAWSNVQSPYDLQVGLSAVLRLPVNRIRVIAHPHGGSFGSKFHLVKYEMITAILSKLCGGRPVKHVEDRLAHLTANSAQAWDRWYSAEFGFARDGRCTAMRIAVLNDSGASSENLVPGMTLKPLVCLTGPYRVHDAEYDVTNVVSNKCPEGAYRGFGPPPHNLVIERMMDKAAAALHLDPAEIRRRNFIQPHEFPYRTASGAEYDSGNYPEVLRVAVENSGYDDMRRQQQRWRQDGRLVGVSVAFGVEPGGSWALSGPYREISPPMIAGEAATLRVTAGGEFQVELYFGLEGQGQFTFATQLVADYFGVPMEAVRVVTAQPRCHPPSFGPAGSRMAVVLSAAVLGAADRLREKLVRVASGMLGTAPETLELTEGSVRVRDMPDRRLPIGQIATIMLFRPDLLPANMDAQPEVTYLWHAGRSADSDTSPYLTYASACHIVLVEIDADTGQPSILKYVITDDCGTRLNPAIVEGQVQGGLAQGIGAVLLEEYVYDENGQPLATTLADYLLPTVYEVPMAEKYAVVTPSPLTPLGIKGTGEGAIHVAPAAVFCAINDALAPLGVELTYASATPERLWRLIQSARSPGSR